ncbi:MAG: YdeI/OmpD-associated family protein [Hyphomicrobiaceae bacterium]
MNARVDAYIKRSKKWPVEVTALRSILLKAGLSEDIKWGKPCYSHNGQNIVIVQEMNDFLALMFFKGALLSDPDGVLHQQGPNSRSALRMQFTSVAEIKRLTGTLRTYLREAIEVEAAGLEIGPPPVLVLVAELQNRIDRDEALKRAFEALTPGRQREYNLYFSDAKQAATRESRIDKCTNKILAGKGFRDS